MLGQAHIDSPSPLCYQQTSEVIKASLGAWVCKLAAVEAGGHSNMHRSHLQQWDCRIDPQTQTHCEHQLSFLM